MVGHKFMNLPIWMAPVLWSIFRSRKIAPSISAEMNQNSKKADMTADDDPSDTPFLVSDKFKTIYRDIGIIEM